jgi:hypothetical protein
MAIQGEMMIDDDDDDDVVMSRRTANDHRNRTLKSSPEQ